METIVKDCLGGYGTDMPCMEPGTEERDVGGLIANLCPAHAAELDQDLIGEELDRLGATEIDVDASPRAVGAVRLFDDSHERHVQTGDVLTALRTADEGADVWSLIDELPEVSEPAKASAWPVREARDSSPTT